VSLRPEPFGALAYHYDNRRLNFLRSHDLVALVKALEHHDSARAAFDAQGLDERRWPSFATALAALAESDFLSPIEP
jgi:putative mycofactocin binding protein MftB